MFHHFHAHVPFALGILILGIAILVAVLRPSDRRDP